MRFVQERFPARGGLLALACAAWMLGCAGCVVVYMNPFVPRKGKLTERTIREAKHWYTTDKVLVLDLSGVIIDVELSSVFYDRESTVAVMKEALRKAEKDSDVKAVVLKVNSPGGGVTASDILYRELKKFKEKKKVPVISCIMDVGASGAYYASMAADEVIIHPTGVTGSIGVIGTYLTFDGLMQKVGVNSVTVKSGEHKDMGSPFRPLSPQERRIFQSIIDDLYGRFLDVVTEGRPKLNKETIRKLADGRIYTAQQAKAAGLVDEIGYLDDAIDLAKRRARLADAEVVCYARPSSFRENIYSRSSERAASGGNFNFINVNAGAALQAPQPVFLYLWKPGF